MTTRRTILALLLCCFPFDAVANQARGGGGGFLGMFSSGVTSSHSHPHDDDDDDDDRRIRSNRTNRSKARGSSWFQDIEFEDVPDTEKKLGAPQDALDHPQEEGAAVLDALQLHPLLQIPLSFSLNGILDSPLTPVCAFCDTAAMRTVMSWDTAKRLGLLPHLDRRYAGAKAVGVGSCRVLGRLPAGLCDLHLSGTNDGTTVTVPSPPITILDTTGTPGVELLLGLDFLREHRAILDLRREELRITVDRTEFCIPFLRPRGSSSVHGLSGGGGGRGGDAAAYSFWGAWGTPNKHTRQVLSFGGDYEDDEEDEFIDMSGV